ncbi:MAG: sulfatase-like hydrolase/transferase, partial [Anaerolineae bacterium]|nr:sulfatase-like hydrolase/transferase [Anaerolineae bacterium]
HHQNRVDDFVPPDGYRKPYENRWIPPDLAALGGSTQQHIAGYYGMVKRLDEAFGRMLDVLKSLGLDENTVVLFTSDHGCHFKTRNSEYKRSCHESCIRVPTALTGPGFNGAGRLSEMISLVDLPPTLLDAAGIEVPESMHGRSILPLANKTAEAWPEEVFLQISEAQVGRAVRTHRWKYSVSAPDKNGGQDPKSDHYVEEFLYDLEADPYELCNLIEYDAYDEVKSVMRERLLRRMEEAGEDRPTIELAPTHPSGQRHLLPGEAYR